MLQRDLKPYVDTAPNELAGRARPLLDRAEAALETLRNLGFTGEDIKGLAASATRALNSPTQPDSVSVSLFLANVLRQKVAEDRLNEIAVVFTSGQPDPATLLDFGYVPPEVSDAAGFDCAPVLASI